MFCLPAENWISAMNEGLFGQSFHIIQTVLERAKAQVFPVSLPQACRARKNFSSLYAIVSALQSNPLHRLRRTWQETDRCVMRDLRFMRNSLTLCASPASFLNVCQFVEEGVLSS